MRILITGCWRRSDWQQEREKWY